MSYRTWPLYDAATGLFLGRKVMGPDDDHLARNLDVGVAAIEGDHDHLTMRVDLSGSEPTVVAYVPPPDPVAEAAAARLDATAGIVAIEGRSIRAIREALLALGVTGRLADDDAAITMLRTKL